MRSSHLFLVGLIVLLSLLRGLLARPAAQDWSARWTCAAPLDEIEDTKFFATPFRFNGNDVECASLDGKVCLRGGNKTCQAWVKEFTSGKVQPKPLTCGAAHKAVYGITGYDTPGHWCRALQAFYRDPSTYCSKQHKTLSVSLGGCGANAGCDRSQIRPWDFTPGNTLTSNGVSVTVTSLEGVTPVPGSGTVEPAYDISAYLMNRCKSKGPLFVMTASFEDPGTYYAGWERLDYGNTLYKCGLCPSCGISMYYVFAGRKAAKVLRTAKCADGSVIAAQRDWLNPCVIEDLPPQPNMKFSIQHKDYPLWFDGPNGTVYGLKIWKLARPPEDYEMIYNETRYAKECDATLHPMAKAVSKVSGWDFQKDYGRSVCPLSPINELIFTGC